MFITRALPRLLLVVAVIITGSFSVSGCSALQPSQDSYLTPRLAVQYATAKIINSDDGRQARVLEIVAHGRAIVESDATVSVQWLYEGVMALDDWDSLDPADRVLIAAILDEAKRKIQGYVGLGELDPDRRVKLLHVLDWIEGAAHGSVSSA